MPLNTEPARGMRDFLPKDVRRREHVIGIVKRVYERYGFEPLETPAVENIETLLGRYGDEGNKLIFKILKRGEHEASGQADLALRYDLTVPLARVVAENHAKLPRLFKRYQIQPVWRADHPARGRFREFCQCDVDTLGSTSPLVEAEVCAAVSDVLTQIGFSDFVIRINHRDLLTAVLESQGFPRQCHVPALIAIDKVHDIDIEGVVKDLAPRFELAKSLGKLLASFPRSNGPEVLEWAHRLVKDVPSGTRSIENLNSILALLANTSAANHIRVDLSLARGLSYYTGAIMELNVEGIGSLGGGGRYDDLVGMFSGQNVPACGFSLGLERILVVMTERSMFPPSLATTPADVMVATCDTSGRGPAMRLADQLRERGLRVLIYPDADTIDTQIQYAESQAIPFVAMLGENEISTATVTVKNFAAQTQEIIDQCDAGAVIAETLRHGAGSSGLAASPAPYPLLSDCPGVPTSRGV
jgi:histidyl-tRNA synthetase